MLIVYFMQLWVLMPKNHFAFLFDLKKGKEFFSYKLTRIFTNALIISIVSGSEHCRYLKVF